MNELSQTERVALTLYALDLKEILDLTYDLNINILDEERHDIAEAMLDINGVEVKMKGNTVTELIVRDRVKFDRYISNLVEYGNQSLSIRVEENRE